MNECAQCLHGSSCPCKHGKCQNTHGSYQCVCELGYEGHQCEIDINDCYPNHCQYGGICHDKIGKFLTLKMLSCTVLENPVGVT